MKSFLKDFEVFHKISPENRIPLALGLELTCRCNLNCRYCYINQSIYHEPSKNSELTIKEIDLISDQALAMGTLWINLTGGEVLVRKDFEQIYILLKKKGFLVSVLTNGTLINENHIKLFKQYPPRSIEISSYGASQKTYEQVTGSKNGFNQFAKGLSLCVEANLPIVLKAMDSKLLHQEMNKIESLISNYKNGYFMVDQILIRRIDQDKDKSKKIDSQRLDNPKNKLALPVTKPIKISHKNHFKGNLFLCNAGVNSCWIDSNGKAHLCSPLRHPEFAYDLKKGTLKNYWENIVPQLLGTCSTNPEFDLYCGRCPERLQCRWCPALSWTENRRLDSPVDFVCVNKKGK